MANIDKKHEPCNHCGGTLMFDGDEIKCLMCGRLAGHHCELCVIKPEKVAKRARKSASAVGKHRQ